MLDWLAFQVQVYWYLLVFSNNIFQQFRKIRYKRTVLFVKNTQKTCLSRFVPNKYIFESIILEQWGCPWLTTTTCFSTFPHITIRQITNITDCIRLILYSFSLQSFTISDSKRAMNGNRIIIRSCKVIIGVLLNPSNWWRHLVCAIWGHKWRRHGFN